MIHYASGIVKSDKCFSLTVWGRHAIMIDVKRYVSPPQRHGSIGSFQRKGLLTVDSSEDFSL